jgi:DNA polymerase theta
MCGRAGRKGKDDTGETYLICIKADLEAVCDLLDADMPAIESCLAPEKRGLKRYCTHSKAPFHFTNRHQGPP